MSVNPIKITDEYADYLHDESKTVGTAEEIVFPRSEEDVIELMKSAYEENKQITIQGARTGLTAACVPDGGRIVSLEKMKKISAVIPGENGISYLKVQPGVLLTEIREAIAPAGLYFPPDPTEATASIGGMAACNSSGAKSYKYKATRAFIEGFRMVLAGGDVISLNRGECFADGRHFKIRTESGRILEGELPSYQMPTCKNASGYYVTDSMDLVDLFVGSDGTLGVFTELTLKLIPNPAVVWGINCFFASESIAVKFVKEIKRLPLAAIEMYDGNALDILRNNENSGLEIPEKYKSLIYVEIHAESQEDAENTVAEVCDAMDNAGGSSEDTWMGDTPKDKEHLLLLRHMVPESVNAIIAERKKTYPKLAKTGTDMAVNDEYMEEVLAMYHRGLEEKGYEYAFWGHIGNNHLHVNVLPRNPQEQIEAKEMFAEWAKKITAMGGTVSAEHGVGKIKANLLRIMYGDRGIEESRRLKLIFDEKNLLNRGNWSM